MVIKEEMENGRQHNFLLIFNLVVTQFFHPNLFFKIFFIGCQFVTYKMF
jgi:hypothetical protein